MVVGCVKRAIDALWNKAKAVNGFAFQTKLIGNSEPVKFQPPHGAQVLPVVHL